MGPLFFLQLGVSLNGSAISAYLMKLQYIGVLDFGKIGKKNIIIQLKTSSMQLSQVEQSLYDLLLEISDEDGKLSSAYSENWELLGKGVAMWEKKVLGIGENELLDMGVLAFDEKEKVRFTEYGYDRLVDFWGYIKHLKEFGSVLSSDGFKRDLSQDDLLFATMFGLRNDMKECFANHSEQFDDDFLFMWQLMVMTDDFNQSLCETTSYSDSGDNGYSDSGYSGYDGGSSY